MEYKELRRRVMEVLNRKFAVEWRAPPMRIAPEQGEDASRHLAVGLRRG